MKNPSTILALIGIIGVLAVAGYFYTQIKNFTPADQITAEQAIAPVTAPDTAATTPTTNAPSAAPAINPASVAPTPTEPVASTPDAAAEEDEDTAEDATSTDNATDVTGTDEASPDTPTPSAADVDMPTDAEMKPQGDLSGNQAVPLADTSSTDADPTEWTACATDADCIPIGTECCAASYTKAVNVKFGDAWLAKHPKQDCDAGAICAMMMTIAHCVAGNCTMNTNPQ